jgi:competence protein ComEC
MTKFLFIFWFAALLGNPVPSQATSPPAATPNPGADFVAPDKMKTASRKESLLRIITLNVCQQDVGDAHLIITPGGKTMLIDAGMPGRGNAVILPWLKKHNIHHIDWMMASHMHDDHMGGMPELLASKDITVGTLLWSPLPYDMMHQMEAWYADESGRLMSLIESECRKKNVPIRQVHSGQILDLGDGVTGEILAAADPQLREPNYINNNSIVMLLKYKKFSMMFTGDQGFEEENRVLARGKNLRCDVLKIGHHAGAGSTSPAWVAALQAKVGIAPMPEYLSNDPRGQRVYKQLIPTGMKIFRSWEDGNIEVLTDGSQFTVLTHQ